MGIFTYDTCIEATHAGCDPTQHLTRGRVKLFMHYDEFTEHPDIVAPQGVSQFPLPPGIELQRGDWERAAQVLRDVAESTQRASAKAGPGPDGPTASSIHEGARTGWKGYRELTEK